MRLLELGAEDAGFDTPTGGEARLWLALAYQVGAAGMLLVTVTQCIYKFSSSYWYPGWAGGR